MPLTSIDFPFQPPRGVGLRAMTLSSSIQEFDRRRAEPWRAREIFVGHASRQWCWSRSRPLRPVRRLPPRHAVSRRKAKAASAPSSMRAAFAWTTAARCVLRGSKRWRNSAALGALVAGRNVTLRGETDAPDRYGRQPAFVFVESGCTHRCRTSCWRKAPPSVSGAVADKACAAELSAPRPRPGKPAAGSGRSIGHKKRGKSGDDILARIGRFTVVEGKVLSVRQAGATTYINFGRRWTRDFAVTISRRMTAAFEAAGSLLSPSKTSEFGSAAGSRRAAGRGSRRPGGADRDWPARIRPAGQRQMTT